MNIVMIIYDRFDHIRRALIGCVVVLHEANVLTRF